MDLRGRPALDGEYLGDDGPGDLLGPFGADVERVVLLAVDEPGDPEVSRAWLHVVATLESALAGSGVTEGRL